MQLQVNGKQYSINDPVKQSSCGTVPVILFEYKDIPESATKTDICGQSSLTKRWKSMDEDQNNSSHTRTYINCLAVQDQLKLFQSTG